MDPLTILGAAASTIQIIDILAKSINTLDSIRTQWQDSDLALLSLTSQLGALSAALNKIQEWMDSQSDEVHHRLVMDLNLAIKCCAILASKVYSEVEGLDTAPDGSLTSTAKAKFMLKRKGVAELQGMIDRQTSILTLLLTACNSKSLIKQQEIVGATEVRKRMDKVQKDSASLVSLVDSDSFLSKRTRNSSRLSVLFDFDQELFTSRPYQAMIRKTVKLSIRSSQPNDSPPSGGIIWRLSPSKRNSTKSSPRYRASDHEALQGVQIQMNLFLLGIGAASKTTFLKQMQTLYRNETSTEEHDFWRNIIYDNLDAILDVALERRHLMKSPEAFCESAVSAKKDLREYRFDHLPPDFAGAFRALCDSYIESNAPSRRLDKIDNLPDNLSYLLQHIGRICAPSYVTTSNDILHARVRTTGVHQYVFNVPQYGVCHAYDFGGERAERKKWKYYFEKNGTVLFLASMSGYDQGLTEDNKANQMEESLLVFESLFASPMLEKSEIVLCFTKMDLLQKKMDIGSSPIKDHFPEFKGPEGDFDAAKEFFTGKFTKLVGGGRRLRIFYLDVTRIEEVRNVLGFVFGDDAPGSVPHVTYPW